MADAKITGLAAAGALTGTELMETVQGGVNVQTTTQDVADLAVTREFNRTFSQTLVFDKNEIFHAPFTQTTAINFEIGAGGLVDQPSLIVATITSDGVSQINFGSGFNFLYGIENGEVLAAGTYEFYFLYTNGSVRVNVPGVTSESSSLVVLAAPANFSAVVDGVNGDTEIDLSWTNNANASSYEIEYSNTGGAGPWLGLTNPAAGSTSYSHTGLTPGTTYHYRIRCIGDGISFANSAYSIAATTTESGGDVTAPTFIFLPASGNVVWPVNKVITITANEAIRNTDASEITNANVATRLTLKETNAAGANIAFTATIDVSKTIITITPTTVYGDNQLVYVAINNVEDVNGNEVTVAISSTFTTTDYTFFNGTSNRLQFGDVLDSVFSVNDAYFELETSIRDMLTSGTRILVSKWDVPSVQKTFQWYVMGADVFFGYEGTNFSRFVKFSGVLAAGDHTLKVTYDGSIDTNDGLDRVNLFIDTIDQIASRSLVASVNALTGTLRNATAYLAVGTHINGAGTPTTSFYSGEMKDLIIRSAPATVEVQVDNLRLGTDSSGNSVNGTWV